MFKKSLVAVTLFFSIAATSTANAQSMADKEITVQQAAGDVYMLQGSYQCHLAQWCTGHWACLDLRQFLQQTLTAQCQPKRLSLLLCIFLPLFLARLR